MDWRSLLSTHRLMRGPVAANQARSEFHKDFDRIVFSSAFRRLQDKTQVFPLAANDYVHTRLTHSIEAACVARSLGTLVGSLVVERSEAPGFSADEFGDVASAAALAHDIGNPPFGHAGEACIRSWFETEGAPLLAQLDPPVCHDLLGFDGNAQGFRVLARLQNARDRGGMQLTSAVLGAFTKYPHRPRPGYPKAGFYGTDEALFEEVALSLGLPRAADGGWFRHPLAHVVEAADDICYSVVDVEDGCRLGLVSHDEAEALLGAIAREGGRLEASRSYATLDDPDARVGYLRALAIDQLVGEAFRIFRERYDEIMQGGEVPALAAAGIFGDRLERIVAFCRQRLYVASDDGGEDSLARRVIFAILRQRLPPSRPVSAPAVMRAVDNLAGMTDSYAVRVAGLTA